MSAAEIRGATGQMELAFEHDEVPGSVEWRRRVVTLDATADGREVILAIHDVTHRGRRRPESRSLVSLVLTPGEVIELFKKHGRPLGGGGT